MSTADASLQDQRERFRRQAAEALAFVAARAPQLLEGGVDTTLHDLTLARTVMERLDDASRHARECAWLRGLVHAAPDRR